MEDKKARKDFDKVRVGVCHKMNKQMVIKECDFCGKKTDGKIVLRDAVIQKKDGSDLILCGDCLNNYVSGDYDKIKVKEKKKYQVVCYMRIEPEEIISLTYEEAIKEKEQGEFMQSENIYKIEEIEDE